MIHGYFRCVKCHLIDHTEYVDLPKEPGQWECSVCQTGVWHKRFLRPEEVEELINESDDGSIELDS